MVVVDKEKIANKITVLIPQLSLVETIASMTNMRFVSVKAQFVTKEVLWRISVHQKPSANDEVLEHHAQNVIEATASTSI